MWRSQWWKTPQMILAKGSLTSQKQRSCLDGNRRSSFVMAFPSWRTISGSDLLSPERTELNWTELHYLYTIKSCRQAYKSANLSLISSIFAPLCYGINGFIFYKSCMVIHIWKIEWYFVSYIRKKRFAVFQRSSPQMLHLPIFLSIQLSIQS